MLREFEQSGLGVGAFARQCGIPVSALRWWRSMRRRGVAALGRRRARPPQMVDVIGTSREADHSGKGFEVILGSVPGVCFSAISATARRTIGDRLGERLGGLQGCVLVLNQCRCNSPPRLRGTVAHVERGPGMQPCHSL